MRASKKKLEDLLGSSRVRLANEVAQVQVITSGIAAIDYITGVGGFPRGSIVEMYGRESIGKSSLAYYAMAERIKRGEPCAYVNVEGNLDIAFAERISGIDSSKVLLADPPPGSAAVEVLNILAASGEFGLIVFDSIGAMSGDKESEPGEKKQAYGQSALVTQMVKAVNDDIKMNGTTCLFLNQVREKAGKFFTIEDTPGGRAIKHHASVRIYLKSGAISVTGTVDKEKAIIMKSIVAKAVKNKVAAPNKTATFNFWMYPSPEGVIGVDKAQEAIDLAFRLGAIDQSGAYYTHPIFPEATKHRIQGKEKVALFLRENPDVLDQLRTDLMTKQYTPTEEPEVSDMEEELEDVE